MTTTTAGKTTTARATPAAKSPAASSRLASSARFKTFAAAFGIAFPVMYVACEWWNLPLFTFHPATNRVDFWWAPGRSGEGPAMYWYGWTATATLGALIFGFIAAFLPERWMRRIWPGWLWVVPTLAMIACVYLTLPWFRL